MGFLYRVRQVRLVRFLHVVGLLRHSQMMPADAVDAGPDASLGFGRGPLPGQKMALTSLEARACRPLDAADKPLPRGLWCPLAFPPPWCDQGASSGATGAPQNDARLWQRLFVGRRDCAYSVPTFSPCGASLGAGAGADGARAAAPARPFQRRCAIAEFGEW